MVRTGKFSALKISALLLAFAMGSAAFAQSTAICSNQLKSAQKNCMEQAIDSCSTAVKECDSRETALTLRDVFEGAISECCGLGKKKARNQCLKVRARSLVTKGRRGVHIKFLRAARQSVRGIIANDCYGTTYQDLF